MFTFMEFYAISESESSDWQKHNVSVLGKAFTLGQVQGGQLYHGTDAKLSPGDIIEPGHKTNFKQSSKKLISFTSLPHIAQHWARESGSNNPRVYHIEPMGEFQQHRVAPSDGGRSFDLLEGRSPKARVIKEML